MKRLASMKRTQGQTKKVVRESIPANQSSMKSFFSSNRGDGISVGANCHTNSVVDNGGDATTTSVADNAQDSVSDEQGHEQGQRNSTTANNVGNLPDDDICAEQDEELTLEQSSGESFMKSFIIIVCDQLRKELSRT